MTEQDKNYIETHKAWVKAQQLNIEEHKLNMKHNLEKAALLQKQANIDEKQLELGVMYLQSGVECFDVWCSDNCIDPKIGI